MATQGGAPVTGQVVGQSSKTKPFSNKAITMRLDETNYLLWKQQVYFTIVSHALQKYIDESVKVSEYIIDPSSGAKVINPEFQDFQQQDSAVASWLLAAISPSILPILIRCKSSQEIWKKLEQTFSASSTTRVMHLHCQLKGLKKRDQSMREYLSDIQMVCDSLASCGHPISETMHISSILSGLPSEYESVVAVITSSQQPYSLQGVCGVLLDSESRQKDQLLANLSLSANLAQNQASVPSLNHMNQAYQSNQQPYPPNSNPFLNPFLSNVNPTQPNTYNNNLAYNPSNQQPISHTNICQQQPYNYQFENPQIQNFQQPAYAPRVYQTGYTHGYPQQTNPQQLIPQQSNNHQQFNTQSNGSFNNTRVPYQPYRGRGRGTTSNRPQCQLCGKTIQEFV